MAATPNEPGVSRAEHEERRSTQGRSRSAFSAASHRTTGAEHEEDLLSLGTDDPAFWLKDPDRE